MIDETRLHKMIGANIKALRLKKGCSQNVLAEEIGLERTSITNIETGKQRTTISVLYKVCQVFQVDLADLLPDVSDVIATKVETSNDSNGVNVGGKTWAAINKIMNG